MKKKELEAYLVKELKSVMHAVSMDPSSWFKPAKKPHYQKYRNSRLHPDEIEKQKGKNKIQTGLTPKVSSPFDFSEPGYDIPRNVRLFLNTTLKALPKTDTSEKILNGLPVTKREAIELARNLIAMPHFPYKQPRKLMSLLILLSIENAKD